MRSPPPGKYFFVIWRIFLLFFLLTTTKRHTNGETLCELCGYHYENCEHFLLHCTALQETRKNVIGLQQPFKESIDETISDFLLFKENSEEIVNRNRDDLQKL